VHSCALAIDLVWRRAKLAEDCFCKRERHFPFPGEHQVGARASERREISRR
jgi:hypothetical protein